MLDKYHKLQPKPKTIDELKVALQTIWEELQQEHTNKVVENFTKCLTARSGSQWWSLRASEVKVHLEVCIVISASSSAMAERPHEACFVFD